jgi:hypothetical protein
MTDCTKKAERDALIAALEKALEAKYVFEYDDAYKCLLCGGTWGAITNPTGHRSDCLLNGSALEAKPNA